MTVAPPDKAADEVTSPTLRVDGQVAIVTGASSGLGRRFAQVLDAAGAGVVLAARRADRLERLAASLARGHAVPLDVTEPSAGPRLIDAAMERFGRVDILVNNAAATNITPALDETDDQVAHLLATNVTSAYAIARAAARAMTEGGAIVNVASILGVVGIGQIPQAGYAASKGAIVQLTRELAAQWARQGIRVNALAPGWFPSEMTTSLFADDQSLRWVERKTPMGRAGRQHELDAPLLFLCSNASSFVTGHVLTVDGGWTAV